MRKHDVIVVGGSLAGAACVRELTWRGIDAVAFERNHFPRPKVCGGFVSPGGVECLEQLGVLDEVLHAGATTVHTAKIRVDSAEVEIAFERAGLGVSRSVLDHLLASGAAVEEDRGVSSVSRCENGFLVSGADFQVAAQIVIDASGKLGRMSRHVAVDEFGIQFLDGGTRRGVLDFWFFDDGYGGGVEVEGGRGNFCFLINKDKLSRYLSRSDCLVTGPLAYERVSGEYIAIGDAAGMVDPFCGEGMRHALDTGMLAARVVADGLRSASDYSEIQWTYEVQYRRRWSAKRRVGALVRRMVKHPAVLARALRHNPERFVNWMWR
jgi:flavin-dependent dehydrogenase